MALLHHVDRRPAYHQRGGMFRHVRRHEEVRGRVWITGDTVHWSVTVNGVRALYDNTGVKAWHDAVLRTTAAVDALEHLRIAGRLPAGMEARRG